MRARNLGHIGVFVAIVLGMVIVVLAGEKWRSISRSQSILTTSPEQPTSQPSLLPTMLPSSSSAPSSQPSEIPSRFPSAGPTLSTSPSSQPSLRPSISAAPSTQPSSTPSLSAMPSESPSFIPSAIPSASSAPSEFFGTSTTIVLDSRSNSAMVAVILILAFSYAAMYMCGKDNQPKDSGVGNTIFSGIFLKNGRQYERDPAESDESEILSDSISRHESDETIDTDNVYPMNCNANGINTREREMDMEILNCNGISSSPIQSNIIDSASEADTKMQDIDLEDGTNSILPNSIAISKYFSSRTGISPLKTPKVFKKRQQSKFRNERLRDNQDRNSSVYARGNAPLRRISRHTQERTHSYSLADDIMDESDHITPKESPVSFYASTKYGLNSDRPHAKESSKETDVSLPDSEGGIECLAYANSKEQKKYKIEVYDLQKDRALRRPETITIKSDGSSTIEWDGDLASTDNLREFDDTMVGMECHGIEVSTRYDSDDID
eukprot:scaffold38308_cov150-Skeletonema_dohrnii-CCMP3373.AAC.2